MGGSEQERDPYEAPQADDLDSGDATHAAASMIGTDDTTDREGAE